MILFVRKHFHKNLTRGLVLVTAFSLVGMGLFTGFISLFTGGKDVFLKVNGIEVGKHFFGIKVATEKRLLGMYQEQLGSLAPHFLAQAGLSMSPEKNAYNKILQDLVLASCIKKSHLQVHTRFLVQKAQDPMTMMNIFGGGLPRALYDKNGKLQDEILLRILQHVGLTMEDFESLLEQAAEHELALNLFRLATPLTDKELEIAALKKYGKRSFLLTTYSLEGYLKKARLTQPTKEELEKFFEEHNRLSNRYWVPEKREGVTWKVPFGKKKDEVIQEAEKSLKDESDFDRFITRHRGIKNSLRSQKLSAENEQSQMLFRLDINNKGMYVDEGHVIIVMPTQVIPASCQNYEQVSKQVKDDFYKEAAQKLLTQDLEEFGVNDEHKKGHRSFALNPDTLKRELEKLAHEGIASQRVENMVAEGSRLKGINEQGGYLILLEKVEKPDSLKPEQVSELRKELLRSSERFLTFASVDSLIKNAKIKGNKVL